MLELSVQHTKNLETVNSCQGLLLLRFDQKILDKRGWTVKDLNAKDTKIHKLQDETNALKASFYGNGTANMVEMISEMWQESKEQRI